MTKKIEVNGEFYTFRELSDKFNLELVTLKQRYYHAGLRGTDLVSSKTEPFSVVYKGKKMSLCQVSKLTGINDQTLRNRYHAGKRGEELFKKIPRGKARYYKGKQITVREFCELTNLPVTTVKRRLKEGMSLEEIEKKPNKIEDFKVNYMGKDYSLEELSDLTGLSEKLLKSRRYKKYRGDRLVQPFNKNLVKIDLNGKEESFKSLSEKSKIKPITIYQRSRFGFKNRDLLRPLGIHPSTNKKPIVEYKGEEWTVIDLAEHLGIKYRTLYARYRAGKTGEDLVKPARKLSKPNKKKAK